MGPRLRPDRGGRAPARGARRDHLSDAVGVDRDRRRGPRLRRTASQGQRGVHRAGRASSPARGRRHGDRDGQAQARVRHRRPRQEGHRLLVTPGPELERRRQGEGPTGPPVLVWRFPAPVRAIATTVLGGGIGDRRWVLNAQVPAEYHVADPEAHAAALGAEQGLEGGAGIGLLTAARVLDVRTHCDGGARCDATVGVTRPTWAAAPDGSSSDWRPGTINLVCWVPAPLGDAALANALATATEA